MWKIRKILAPTDLSHLSRVGVRGALELAESQAAEVIVYSVVEYPESYSRGPEGTAPGATGVKSVDEVVTERLKKLEKFLETVFPELMCRIKVQVDVDLGTASENIVDKAAQENVDIIVMSTRGRIGLERIMMGSVTEQVVRHSPCQVLSMRVAA